MKTQLVVTAETGLIEELKTVIEGFIGQRQNKAYDVVIETKPPMVFDDIRQLKGILNPYYHKPLTDEDIENGIHQGIMQRAMIE